jgi:hypothetical protein
MRQGHVAVVAGAWRRRRSLRALLLPLYSSDREQVLYIINHATLLRRTNISW